MRLPRLIFFICVMLSPAAFAGEPAETAVPEFTGEIALGATFPLTGAHETYGQSAFYGQNDCERGMREAGGGGG